MRVIPSFNTPGVLGESVATCVQGLEVLSGRVTPQPQASAPLRVGLLADLLEEAEVAVAATCERAVGALGGETAVEAVRLDWKPDGFGVALAHELAESWGEGGRP